MGSEIEIKLSMDAGRIALARKWLLSRPGSVAGRTIPMRNIYYDTPEGELNRQRVALRIRQAGDVVLQTLKTRGEVCGGVARRQEWEWVIPAVELDRAGLADTPLAGSETLDRLQPCFETCFERQLVDLEVQGEAGQNAASIECALDQGEITADQYRLPLCELELELKGGDEKAVTDVAAQLVAEVPALVNSISKAEQGYFLAGLYQGPEYCADPVEQWISLLSWTWLQDRTEGWPTVLEAHRNVSDQADRAELGGLWSRIDRYLDDAMRQRHSPRQTLLNLPGLARLQLGLALG